MALCQCVPSQLDASTFATHPILALNHRDVVTCASEQGRGCQATEATADDDYATSHGAVYEPKVSPATNWTPATAPAR